MGVLAVKICQLNFPFWKLTLKLFFKKFLFSKCLFQACWGSCGEKQSGGELAVLRTGAVLKCPGVGEGKFSS